MYVAVFGTEPEDPGRGHDVMVCDGVCACMCAVRDCREIHGTPLVAAVVHKTVVAVARRRTAQQSGGYRYSSGGSGGDR